MTFEAAKQILGVRPKAETNDAGKEPLAHLPWAALDEMARVQAYGHKKYGDFYNYRKGMEVSRIVSCMIRHLRDYMNGADKDHESGLHPISHAITRGAMLLQNLHDGTAIDDRFKAPASRVAVLEQMLEDVACGAKMACIQCGKNLPCMCEHKATT